MWTTLPSKLAIPGMSGVRGWDRKPVAVIRKRVVKVSPPASATRHTSASSSHRAPSTVVLNRMWRRTSYLSATSIGVLLDLAARREQP